MGQEKGLVYSTLKRCVDWKSSAVSLAIHIFRLDEGWSRSWQRTNERSPTSFDHLRFEKQSISSFETFVTPFPLVGFTSFLDTRRLTMRSGDLSSHPPLLILPSFRIPFLVYPTLFLWKNYIWLNYSIDHDLLVGALVWGVRPPVFSKQISRTNFSGFDWQQLEHKWGGIGIAGSKPI